jgi:hypothetical protein
MLSSSFSLALILLVILVIAGIVERMGGEWLGGP